MATDPKKESKPRSTPMKWQKLGEGKDPEFKETYFLYRQTGTKEKPLHQFSNGVLDGINQKEGGKVFSWNVSDHEEPQSSFTHFAICKPPTE